MAIKKIPWITGNGNIVIDFSGQGNDAISISSDTENSGSDRQQDITFKTTKGTTIEIVRTIKQEGSLKPVDGVYILRNCGREGDIFINDVLVGNISYNTAIVEGVTVNPGDVIEIRDAILEGDLPGPEIDFLSILYDYDPINKTYTELRGLSSVFQNEYFHPVPVIRLSDLPEGHYYAIKMVLSGDGGYYFPFQGVNITTSSPTLEFEYNNRYVVTGNEEMYVIGDDQYTYIPILSTSNRDNLNVEYTGKSYSILPDIYGNPISSVDVDGGYLLIKGTIIGYYIYGKLPYLNIAYFIKVIK